MQSDSTIMNVVEVFDDSATTRFCTSG